MLWILGVLAFGLVFACLTVPLSTIRRSGSKGQARYTMTRNPVAEAPEIVPDLT